MASFIQLRQELYEPSICLQRLPNGQAMKPKGGTRTEEVLKKNPVQIHTSNGQESETQDEKLHSPIVSRFPVSNRAEGSEGLVTDMELMDF